MTSGDKIKLRAEIAKEVIASLSSIPFDGSSQWNKMPQEDAQRAVQYADALMAELGLKVEE